MPNPRLFLIDGSGLCYRAYYAIPGLATSTGQPTGAVFGFINILNKLLKKDPEYLACCFDVSKDTHRKKIYKDYKINRPSAPEEMISQIGLIKEALSAYHIPALEAEGYEADDLIASVCAKARTSGLDVVIISSDKDLLQLVEDGVSVFDPRKDKEGFVYTEEEVKARFGVSPRSLLDIFALTGDPTDNIPGVKGIGEKTALGLINEFSGIHNLIEQADKIKSNSLRQAVKDNVENIRLSYELFQLKNDLEIDFNPGDFRRAQPDYARLYDLFKRLEFNRLLKGLPEFGGGDDSSLREDFEPGLESLDNADNNKRAEIWDSIRKTGELFFALEADKAYFYLPEKVYSVSMEDNNFQGLLIEPGVRKIGHNLKEAKSVFLKRGIDVQGMFFDVMLAGYLLEPGLAGFSLSELAFKYLDKRYLEDKLSAPGRLGLIVRLFPVLKEKLKENGLDGLFYELEMPLSCVLARMERNGVKIDTPALSALSRQMEESLISLRSRIYGLNSGSEFNLNSPRQLADALFNRLKLPVVKKTKTGPSTDEEVLRKLAKVHQLPALVMEYRRINKLKSTYVDALPDLIDPLTQRIHASFDQTGTETG
ncbi:MAG TPA: DNA polymerase, partial [Candidatus Omnitrophota bacterium]|nr:DNA polymerase [Candidatus Omnitrophota bacterium]